MKYQISEEDEFLIIKVSGKTRKNEAVLSNALLNPYLHNKGVKVIFDLKELEKFDPMTLLGVLNSLKEEDRSFRRISHGMLLKTRNGALSARKSFGADL